MNNMPSDSSTSSEFQGIKRIQQACLNCRKKKVKCSGDRPACKKCRRLAQNCQYWEKGQLRPTSPDSDTRGDTSNSQSKKEPTSNEALVKKVAAIDSKLDTLIDIFQRYITAPPELAMSHKSPGLSSNASQLTDNAPQQIYEYNHSKTVHEEPNTFKRMPPLEIVRHLIEVYFLRVHNQPYSVFHEQSFRKQYLDGLLPDYLIFAVLASAVRFSTDSYHRSQHRAATKSYSTTSWKIMVSLWFADDNEPNLQICQAITLLSIADFTAGRRHHGWLKIGLAIRIAQDLRLMMEPDCRLNHTAQEERRRVFWSIYILDKLCSCGRDRPAAIADVQCSVQLPGHEWDFRNGNGKQTQTLEEAFMSTDQQDERLSHFALLVLVASTIARCAQHMIHKQDKSDGTLPFWNSKSEYAEIDSRLLFLEARFGMGRSIAEALTSDCLKDGVYDMGIAGPIIFSYALFHTSQCILRHPFLLYQHLKVMGIKPPARFLSQALEGAREGASQLSRLLDDAKALGCQTCFSFVGYCATIAASIHVIYIGNEDSSYSDQAAEGLKLAQTFLEEYSQAWNGYGMLNILYRLASRPSSVLKAIMLAPQFEVLSVEEEQDLWDAVDQSTMAKPPEIPISLSNIDMSLGHLNGMPIAEDQRIFAEQEPIVGSQGGDLAAYYVSMIEAMSPFSKFFKGNHLDFGA